MHKDDATWLNVAYIVFFALTSFVGYKALQTVGLQTGWIERYDWFNYVQVFGGLAIGAVTTYALKSDRERHDYLLASITEMRKVTWPTPEDTKRMTVIVCVVCGILALVIAAFDFVWASILHKFFA
jgi:preprotein translocase subunit SecE